RDRRADERGAAAVDPVVARGVEEPGGAQRPQPCADALAELARGLAREREAEHALGLDEPVDDEVHDARGHRLGLARARTGDHEHGLERRLDDGDLLGRRPRQAEPLGDVGRAVPDAQLARRGHAPTTRPSACAGQDRRTGHTRHRSFSCAATAERVTVATTSSTSAAAQPGSASCASGTCVPWLCLAVVRPTYTSDAPALRAGPVTSSNAPASSASWYAPSCGCRRASASDTADRPVLRSTTRTTAAPSSSVATCSSRSTVPRRTARPTRASNGCSTASARPAAAKYPARCRTIDSARRRWTAPTQPPGRPTAPTRA